MTYGETPHAKQDEREFAEEQASLIKITVAPLIWALHFVACYGLIAVTCSKGWDFGGIRSGLILFSVAALVGIAWTGWRAWCQWKPARDETVSERHGRSRDRHYFLGHAAFLLSIIAFIGVVFVSLPLVMIGGCQ
ncbi:hypothetical protein HGE68_06600 [Rhodobacteraceae bacterium R_SAG6]|nr:hypothetical protein [Rhodobacteraceae bacterium R_SAG6]